MSEWDRQTAPGGVEGPQWVSAAEAADVAGVTPGTVRYWARNGLIVSEVVEGPAGEKTLVRLDEVLQYARQEGGSRGGPPPRGPTPAQAAEPVTELPARTSELAPILKSIPEIMAQLTAATDRAARAETKVEFLSAQLADLRRRLADAEATRDAVAEVTLPPAWEKTESPEETTPAETPAALHDEPAPEPGPEAVDWTAGDPGAAPAPVEEAPGPAGDAVPAASPAPGPSLEEIWSHSAGDDSSVDWHEPARPVSGAAREGESTVAAPRPANAPVPEDEVFYQPRRRRWFRRRR